VTIQVALGNRDFDFATATDGDVYFAFIVKLPFRLRVADLYHCHLESQHGEYDLWVRNVQIGTTEPLLRLHTLIQQGGKIEDLWSTVAVMPNKVRLTPEELTSLRICQGDLDKIAVNDRLNKHLWLAMQALNAFIIGYHTATGEMFGGAALQTLTVHDYFINALSTQVILVGIPLSHWTEDTIKELFDLKADRAFRITGTLNGEITDLPAERLADIGDAIRRLNTFYLYEQG
jgi:hypothetical protein